MRIQNQIFPFRFGRLAAMFCLLGGAFAAHAQNYAPASWVNDPFCTNQNFTVTRAASASPSFANNGEQRGSLYANSPIGATLKLEQPGDTISCTGQMILAGDINPDGNLQFRLGFFHQGSSTADTNWLGYMFGNPTGPGGEARTGFFVRLNPNTSVYTSGSFGNVTRPPCGDTAYAPGWAEGTYDFSLVITQLSGPAQGIAWKLTGVAPNTYRYTGSFTNTVAATLPPAFDQIGILGGAALFNSATTADRIAFKDVTVTLTKSHETK